MEELFGLDESEPHEETYELPVEPSIEPSLISQETLTTIEKVENALSEVKDLDKTDTELDELGSMAKEAFNNLLDLGMQVDSRFSAEIFNSASSMLGHAITAKTAKINKKLKMIDLQLKQASLESRSKNKDLPPVNLGQGSVIDRNELIKQLMDQQKKDKDK